MGFSASPLSGGSYRKALVGPYINGAGGSAGMGGGEESSPFPYIDWGSPHDGASPHSDANMNASGHGSRGGGSNDNAPAEVVIIIARRCRLIWPYPARTEDIIIIIPIRRRRDLIRPATIRTRAPIIRRAARRAAAARRDIPEAPTTTCPRRVPTPIQEEGIPTSTK